MLADLKGGVVGGLTQVAMGSTKGGIPFAIQGTTSSPRFIPDMKGVAGSVAQGILGQVTGGKNSQTGNAVDAITGLFGKKKPK